MEEQEVLVGERVMDNGVISSGDGSEHQSSGVKESENMGDHLLEDLESYLQDINDRLTISRMVSDSVIKGMVNAVEEETAEKIAAKESEVASLKEKLQFLQVGGDEIEFSGSQVAFHEPRSTEHELSSSFSDTFMEHDRIRESLGSLRNVARGQIKKLRKEIEGLRGCSSIRKISSGSELVGLSGILREKASENWVGVDKTLDTLKTTLDTICTQVSDMLHLAKASVCESQQEKEFQGELEAMVIQSCIRSLQEEFEEKLWDQNACFCGSQNVNWLEKINEISGLREELDAILKPLSISETGHLISHGSFDLDNLHHKASSNHISSSSSLSEENGKFDESITDIPKNWDAAQLKHLSKEELVNYFNTVITKMKRNHESTVQKKTEEYFILRREYLRERGSSLHLRKDKEFDILRKKIPEVILKLDNLLVENEKLPTFSNNGESLDSFKDRLENLLLENRQLRDSLTDKNKELMCLSSQVSGTAEKMLQQSLTEMNFLKLIENLKSDVEDERMEAFVSEEVYKCVLREMITQIKCDTEESEMESIVMHDIFRTIFREVAHDAEATSKCEIEDSDMESLIMQPLCGVIFREVIKDAESQINNLNTKYLYENENRVSLEMKALEREEELRLKVEEKEKLRQEVQQMAASMEDKEKIAQELSVALTTEREQFQLASQELHNLRDHASQLQTLIFESNKELDIMKGKLGEAVEQIEVDKVEINKLNQKLEVALKELRETDEQRNMLLIVAQEKQNDLLLVQAKEKEQRKQMEAIIVLVHGLSKALVDFECRVSKGIKKNNLRLEDSSSQLSSLIQKANRLGRTELLYKQGLERRCSDLQMAEAEVDLLGDQVDALLSLLEKIYIALDHYSPILQHYPGIIEILKLVRRELSGESIKPV
uniref:Putative WPP domain-associated protein n=1 Tax=Davidia involucrata TaxID=16924 RepID=A0A5B7BJP8_DAVIN